MKRKILSLFMILCMLLSLNVSMAPIVYAADGTTWDESTYAFSTDDNAGESADNPIIIDTAGKLAYLAEQVNAGTSYSGTYFKQTANLNLDSKGWTPIGTSSNPFSGTFDGGDYTISNVSITSTETQYVGLFGYVNTAKITNLNVRGTITASYAGEFYVGGIIGFSEGGLLENCSADVTINASTTGISRAGSVCGAFATAAVAEINDCHGSGSVTIESSTSDSSAYVGGFIGSVGGGSTNMMTIANCSSSADVSAKTPSELVYAGGFAGIIASCDTYNCYATGTVTGTVTSYSDTVLFAGGFIGFISDSKSTIDNCYSTGTVTKTADSNAEYTYLGGFCGGAACTITNDYWLDSAATNGNGEGTTLSGLVSLTSAQMTNTGTIGGDGTYADSPFLEALNAEAAMITDESVDFDVSSDASEWEIVSGKNSGYPVFKTILPDDSTTWTGYTYAFSTDNNAGESADNPIIIDTAGKLAYLAEQVNAGTSYSGTYFKLTANLDLDSKEWTPIGATDDDTYYHPFSGAFDGGEHTISNLSITSDSICCVGLFGYVDGSTAADDSKITDLNVNGTIDASYDYSFYTGGIVGLYKNGRLLDNCSADVTINVSCKNPYKSTYAGSVCGGIANSGGAQIINCSGAGAVTATNTNAASEHARIGGFAGYLSGGTDNLTIINCSSSADVTAVSTSGETSAGGFAYWNYNCDIYNCYATGNVECTSNNTANLSFSLYAGGFLGQASNTSSTINNCYSTGTVTRNAASTNTTTNYLGGFVGLGGSTITNCYYLDSAATVGYGGSTAPTSLTSLTSAQMTGTGTIGSGTYSTSTFLEALNAEAANITDASSWAIVSGTNSGYPYFSEFVLPTNGSFTDGDSDKNQISGDITWTAPSSTTNITGYKIYWGSDATTKLAGNTDVVYTVSDSSSTSQTVAANTELPSGAKYFLIYSYNSDVNSNSCLAVPITDSSSVDYTVTNYEGSTNDYRVNGGTTSYATLTAALSHCSDLYNSTDPNSDGKLIIQLGTDSSSPLYIPQSASNKLDSSPNQLIDATYTGNVSIKQDTSILQSQTYGLYVPAEITAHLSGLTIAKNTDIDTNYALSAVYDLGTLYVEAGTAIETTNRQYCVFVDRSSAKFYMTGGSLSHDETGTNAYCVYIKSESVGNKISGGTISAGGSSYAVNMSSGCGLTISDTAKISRTATTSINLMYGICSSGDLTIEGGTISLSSETAGDQYAILAGGGTLTMTGGKIENTNSGNGTTYGIYNPVAEVTISGGEISCTSAGAGACAYGILQSSNDHTVTVSGTAQINVNAPNVFGIYANSTKTNGDGAVMINGGTMNVNATSSGANVYNNGAGTVNISGGSMESDSYAIQNMRGGAVNISGGTVTATGSSACIDNQKGTVTISESAAATPTKIISASTGTTISLTKESSSTKATIFEKTFHASDAAGLAITGAVNGDNNEINFDNYGSATVKANSMNAGIALKKWTSDEALTTAIGTTNDVTISSLTTGDYASVTDIYIKAAASVASSDDAGLTSILSKNITAGSGVGTASDPKTASISVANSVSTVDAADITGATDSTVVFYGTGSTFTTAETGSVALTEGDKTTVYVKVTAEDGQTVSYYAVEITRAAASGSDSYFLITKSSPSDSTKETNYYYVYSGNSETALSSFHGSNADSESSTAYSTVDKAITDINASAASSAMMYFAASGNTIANASGTLDVGNCHITLTSGTYTIKGDVKTTQSMGGNGLFNLQGASVIIDGATIDSAEIGIRNTGSGNVTVNSGTITSTSLCIAIDLEGSGNVTINGGTITSSSGAIDFQGNGSVTVNGGTIFGTYSAISSNGTGNVIVNSGTITSDNDVISFATASSGNLTVNGGEILSRGILDGEAIRFDGSGNLTITDGKMYSSVESAVDYRGTGSIIISGDLWDDNTQTGTLLSTHNNDRASNALSINGGVTSVEIKGGTLLAANTAVYTRANITISGGLIKTTSSNTPALYNENAAVTITGGTITSSNENTSVDVSDQNNMKFPGAIFLLCRDEDITTKLYINGGTITNTAATGYAVYNYCMDPEYGSYIYLSGNPSITGNTSVYSYNNIYANDGNSTYYTGSPVTIYYSESITPGTTVAVSDVSSTANASLFSLVNEGYSLQFSGTDLIIVQTSSSSLTSILSKNITAGSEAGTAEAPKTASISVANSVSAVAATDIAGVTDSTVTFYGTDSTFTTAETGSVALTAGVKTTVYIKVTAQDGQTVCYYAVEIRRAAATSNDSSLSTVLSKGISTEGSGGTAAVPKTASISVANSVSSVAAVDIAGATGSTVSFYGTDSTFTTAETGSVALTAGSSTTVYIKVTSQDGQSVGYYAVGITRTAATGSSTGSSGGGSSTANPSGTGTVNVVVNGKTENAGTETKSTEEGKSVVTVAVNNSIIESKIEEAIKTNTTGQQNVIQVPVADTKSDVVKVELTGDIVKQLETNTFDVSVKRDAVEYVIPAKELTISNVAKELGVAETSLKDIKVEVQITKLDDAVVAKYNEVAKQNGATIVFPPTAFEVVAKTTDASGKTENVKIDKFSNYVERIMEIPAGVDPNKITTGIVFNADGTYSHVPTDVYQKDGKWYAKLNSLTNSNYSVVWNPVTVNSVENHWAKDAVNDMASRLVIFNDDTFEPNNAITRADFAEYIVRALGVYRQGEHQNKFTDVNATGDRTLAILIASEYGIVTGYPDGTFRPDSLITREEAMTMYQRAMKVTKLTGTDANRYQNYTDFSQVGGWATSYVKEVLSAHVFNGNTATTIAPKASLTYAEAAQAIKNLLVESKLINK